MHASYRLLIRFIDLGLLLLMAFLATAALRPAIQVPLPRGAGESALAYRIAFDAAGATVRREPSDTNLCQITALDDLVPCLRTLRAAPAPVLLTPLSGASTQRLVRILDLCQQAHLICALSY